MIGKMKIFLAVLLTFSLLLTAGCGAANTDSDHSSDTDVTSSETVNSSSQEPSSDEQSSDESSSQGESNMSSTTSETPSNNTTTSSEVSSNTSSNNSSNNSSNTSSEVSSNTSSENKVEVVAPKPTVTSTFADYINYANGLPNTYKKLNEDKALNVVYIGGSLTNGTGGSPCWRVLVTQWFDTYYPNADINHYNSGIGGTGSRYGAYRLERDVLSHEPDLVFIDFAINDIYKKETTKEERVLYETLIREILEAYPDCEIVSVFFTDNSNAALSYRNSLIRTAEAQKEVGDYYGIPSINAASALIKGVMGKDYANVWSKYFTDIVHASALGYKAYADCIIEFLANSLFNKQYTDADYGNKAMPEMYGDMLYDGNRTNDTANLADLTYSNNAGGNGFTITTTGGVPIYNASGAGATFVYSFTGTEIGFYSTYYGKYSMEISIDGGDFEKYSYTQDDNCVILYDDLEAGQHTITIKATSATVQIGAFLTRDATKQTVK